MGVSLPVPGPTLLQGDTSTALPGLKGSKGGEWNCNQTLPAQTRTGLCRSSERHSRVCGAVCHHTVLLELPQPPPAAALGRCAQCSLRCWCLAEPHAADLHPAPIGSHRAQLPPRGILQLLMNGVGALLCRRAAVCGFMV